MKLLDFRRFVGSVIAGFCILGVTAAEPIGIIGHSEGGQIACMLAAQGKDIDFIVSVAGPSVKGTKTIAYQNKKNLSKSGRRKNSR